MRPLREGRSPRVRLPGRSVLVLLLLGSEGVIAGPCEARALLFLPGFYLFCFFLANCYRYPLVYRVSGEDREEMENLEGAVNEMIE